jgi:hypothetical protein
VIVAGLDAKHATIYIYDPFMAVAPIEMSVTEFMIGWEEKNRQYAVIALASPDVGP